MSKLLWPGGIYNMTDMSKLLWPGGIYNMTERPNEVELRVWLTLGGLSITVSMQVIVGE